ncbi:hypothetical protein BH11BAC3_BH11BAC3_36630 [soil metagenome]
MRLLNQLLLNKEVKFRFKNLRISLLKSCGFNEHIHDKHVIDDHTFSY